MAVFDAGGDQVRSVHHNALGLVVARPAEGLCERDRWLAGCAGLEGLDIAVVAALRRPGGGHLALRAAGHIQRAIRRERGGRRLVVQARAAPLGPDLIAGAAEDGDKAVAVRRIVSGRAGIDRPVDRAPERASQFPGDGDLPVRGDSQPQACRGVRRAQGPGIDLLSGGVVLEQRHILAALDPLAVHGAIDVSDHVDGAVGSDLCGAHRLDVGIQGVGENPSIHPIRLPCLLQGARNVDRVGLEFEQLALGYAVVGCRIVVRIRVAHRLRKVYCAGRLRGAEAHRLAGSDVDLHSVVIDAGGQSDRLLVHRDGCGLGGKPVRRKTGRDPGRGQLGVHIVDHIRQAAGVRTHSRQVDRNVEGRRAALDRDVELHISIVGRHVGAERRRHRGRGVARGACGGSYRELGHARRAVRALRKAQVGEAGVRDKARDLPQTIRERFRELLQIGGRKVFGRGLVGHIH